MRILYVAMKYDYGRPEQGLSFEHHNFYHSLLHMGHDVVYFDFMTLLQAHGRSWMNARLLEVAKVENPDLIFTVLFTDELDSAVLRALTDEIAVPTVNWFCDDHWRFENYSRLWAPCFRWVVTTAASALPKYAALGYRNVIKSQWGCNSFMYRRMDLPLVYDVTFIGQPYGHRRAVIDQLRRAGVTVQAWGSGWESGRVAQEEMIRIFNQSRINLNLTTAYGHTEQEVTLSSRAPSGLMARLFSYVPFMPNTRSAGGPRPAAKGESDLAELLSDGGASTLLGCPEQIKGRNFEVPGCGGFLLTGNAENLGGYYEIGKEVVCFHSVEEMIERVQYYLAHDEERRAIADAGYERTLRDHTYEQRFRAIFACMGVSGGAVHSHDGQLVQPGCTQEVR